MWISLLRFPSLHQTCYFEFTGNIFFMNELNPLAPTSTTLSYWKGGMLISSTTRRNWQRFRSQSSLQEPNNKRPRRGLLRRNLRDWRNIIGGSGRRMVAWDH